MMKTNQLASASVLALLCLTFLCACTSVPLSTIWKLRNFDPLDANPNEIRIAVITDQIIQLEDESVSLQLGFSSADRNHDFSTMAKATVKANATVGQLQQYVEGEQRITLFYLADSAADAIRLAQNRLRIIKQNDIQGNGSLTINVHMGCFNGPKPDSIVANVYAQFSPNQGYVKMISNIDLLHQANVSDSQFWQQCTEVNLATSSR
ncbi:MAG: hypothetical protein JKX81_08415 [Arenicella sp.]|nr:hypothetical protein [Arenicella sp.]